jgi:hypothetical protein
MSTTTLPASASVTEDWHLVDEESARPVSLVVELRRRAYVFPYFRFVSAEGDNSQLSIVFGSHRIVVTGHGLAQLVAALATQRVSRLVEPSENDAKFGVRASHANPCHGPGISKLAVEELP